MGGRVKNEGAKKRSSKTIDIVSYALKVGENGVTCVFVVHVSTKTCVTGNDVILHKALCFSLPHVQLYY